EAETRSTIAAYVPENSTAVLGGWSNAEQKVEDARQALNVAEANGDAKTTKSAQKALAKAETNLAEQMARAIDDDGKGNAGQSAEMLPERRGKQPRLMPAVTPHSPKVRYLWFHSEPDEDVRA